MNWDSDIRKIKGVGEKTAALLQRLELFTVKDLLYYLPRDYEQFGPPRPIGEWKAGETAVLRLRLARQEMELRKKGRHTLLRFFAADHSGRVEITYFNMPFMKKILVFGREYVFRGKLEQWRAGLALNQPKCYSPEEYEQLLDTLKPVYGLTKGLTSSFLQKAVKDALSKLSFKEVFTPSVLERYGLCGREEAFRALHFPRRRKQALQARKRLVFEEFLAFCLTVKGRQKEGGLPVASPLLKTADAGRLLMRLPYRLTGAQLRAWEQIEEDMAGDTAMNRMIQGDVGSGKTILAILALLMCAANGRQGALMAPTETLAGQHMESLRELSRAYGLCIHPVLLTGSLPAKEKQAAKKAVAEGRANVIVGTHALIQEQVEYKNLALVITDEQHRFGVRQRKRLQDKGENTHVLVMSATPIPRTLAIILFGDLHLSVLDELPVGRLPIKNCVVNPSYRPRAYQFMEKEIAKGRQIYCICPLVEETETAELENVADYAEKLRGCFGAGARIGCLHGRMKPALKTGIMEEFACGKLDILVSTTVVEVGVNVPNATVMMVENAERFGLAQLHQLRGRVGRGREQSYCIFVNTQENNPDTVKRLELLLRSNDGFFLANEDMKLRGPGDLFGVRQSGELPFVVGDIYQDSACLLEAAALAEEILERGGAGVFADPSAAFWESQDKAVCSWRDLCGYTGAGLDFRSI